MASSLGSADHSWHWLSPAEARHHIAESILPSATNHTALGDVTLRPHQVRGFHLIEEALRQFGGALLADDVGMGKTFTALAAAQSARELVVVAPATLRKMWHDAGQRTGRALHVLSFEQLSRGVRPPATPDFVIIDEAHHLRNPRTRRYRAAMELTRTAGVLLLTATPVHNRERDLRHLLALFLGSRAQRVPDDVLRRCTVRRTLADLHATERLPAVSSIQWLALPHPEELLTLLTSIPAPVPPSDGGVADALLGLMLLRLWSSSTAAVRHAMRRMWMRAAALTDALQQGRYPSRTELTSWPLHPDGLQLAFVPLVAATPPTPASTNTLLDRLDAHMTGLRRALDALAAGPDVDAARAEHLGRMIQRDGEDGVVAFTQYAETARMLFRRLPSRNGVMLLTAEGGLTGAGRITRDDVLAAAHPSAAEQSNPRLPLHALLSTDLLSEGVNLARLRHVLHVDLPWTPARVHQRIGRLRRPDSPHGEIRVSAFEPPAPAEALVGVIRTLQHKAAAERRLVSSGDLLHGAPWSGGARPTGSGQLDLEADLRRCLIRWIRSVESRPSVRCNAPAISVVYRPDMAHWTALLLVASSDSPALLVATANHVTDDLTQVIEALPHFESDIAGHPRFLEHVVQAFDGWAARARVRSAVSDVEGADSPAHRAALRLLADLEEALPRQARLLAGARLTNLRQWVQQVRGAGAEQALADAVAVALNVPNGTARLSRLEALCGRLRQRHTERDTPLRLDTVLIATPEPFGA